MADRINPLYFELYPRKPTKGDKRRADILETTIEMLGKLGVENVNFDSIASKMKIRRSHVAYYFKDTEELIYQCMLFVLAVGQAAVVDALKDSTANSDLLAAYVRGNFDFLEMYPNESRVYLLGLYKSTMERKWRELFVTIRNGGSDRLAHIIGERRPELSQKAIRDLALEAHDLITMHFAFFLSYGPDVSLRKYEARVVKAVRELISV
jgi:AcrR family transcriptional regulator